MVSSSSSSEVDDFLAASSSGDVGAEIIGDDDEVDDDNTFGDSDTDDILDLGTALTQEMLGMLELCAEKPR